MERLHSRVDRSINIVFDDKREARYVRRKNEYYAIYVSSQTGCDKACRFCHLTQTGQTDYTNVTVEGIIEQIREVDEYVKKNYDAVGGHAPLVHINFMARGEPFANPHITNNLKRIFTEVTEYFKPFGQTPRFNISTIMPHETGDPSFVYKFEGLKDFNYEIYYSLYSARDKWRKRWIPKAISAYEAVVRLNSIQKAYGTRLTIHHALIKNENDGISDIIIINELVKSVGIDFKFNLVRYNPYSEGQGEEAFESIRKRYMDYMIDIATRGGTKVISRVGTDVKASCGMFVE